MRWSQDEQKQKFCDTCRKAKKLPPTENCGQCDTPEIFESNLRVIDAYYAVRRCWKRNGLVSQGFDWAGVKSLMELLQIPNAIDMTEGLLVIEGELLDMEYERLEKQQGNTSNG